MPRLRAETLSIRIPDEIKQLLRLATDRERRPEASMAEILMLEYAWQHGLQAPTPQPPTDQGAVSR